MAGNPQWNHGKMLGLACRPGEFNGLELATSVRHFCVQDTTGRIGRSVSHGQCCLVNLRIVPFRARPSGRPLGQGRRTRTFHHASLRLRGEFIPSDNIVERRVQHQQFAPTMFAGHARTSWRDQCFRSRSSPSATPQVFAPATKRCKSLENVRRGHRQNCGRLINANVSGAGFARACLHNLAQGVRWYA